MLQLFICNCQTNLQLQSHHGNNRSEVCRRHQTAAADEDNDEERRLLSGVLSSVVMITQLSDHMMQEREIWKTIICSYLSLKTDEYNELKYTVDESVEPFTAVMEEKPLATPWLTKY